MWVRWLAGVGDSVLVGAKSFGPEAVWEAVNVMRSAFNRRSRHATAAGLPHKGENAKLAVPLKRKPLVERYVGGFRGRHLGTQLGVSYSIGSGPTQALATVSVSIRPRDVRYAKLLGAAQQVSFDRGRRKRPGD